VGKKIYPELAVAIASAAWGLFWIPLRAFNNNGLTASWAVLAQFLTPLLILIPFALFRLTRKRPTGIGQYRTGILVGFAVSLYLESLLLTDVARSLILFYVMPIWATILEVVVLHRPLTKLRGISLGLGILGMVVIIFNGSNLAVSLNLGDLLALLSGILFSFGALKVRQAHETSVFEQLFAFFLFSSLASFCFTLLPISSLGSPPTWTQIGKLAPWLALTAAGFLIPVMSGIYWGSRHVNPGRLGILLQIEAVVGIISAALLAGEPFGVRQATGAVLVVGAGLIEMLGIEKSYLVERSK
jgi:drug/metabolite transporter (DMT)-like permease